MANLQHFRYIN